MTPESVLRFACFGSRAAVHVGGSSGSSTPEQATQRSRERLLDVHLRLSRFIADSELSELNRSQARALAATPLMRRFAQAVVDAGLRSRGLVDATRLDHLQRVGYRESMQDRPGVPLRATLAAAPPRRPASAHPAALWRAIEVDEDAGLVRRPPGVLLDSGGIGKGLAADLVAAGLREHPTFAVDCAGDIRIGGSAGTPRRVLVDDPFGGSPLHELTVTEGAVATSGIGKRAWWRPDGRPAHHLIDPGSGEPAYTGIVQVTALAPTAQLAEVLAKTALLRGPKAATGELPYGGVVVLEDRSHVVVPGPAVGVPSVPSPSVARVAG